MSIVLRYILLLFKPNAKESAQRHGYFDIFCKVWDIHKNNYEIHRNITRFAALFQKLPKSNKIVRFKEGESIHGQGLKK